MFGYAPPATAQDNEYYRFASDRKFGDLLTPYETGFWKAREEGRVRYAWAIPNEPALDALASVAPLVEIGAGCGYWAHLLRQRGVDIIAYDIQPPVDDGHRNFWCRTHKGTIIGLAWTTVLRGGPYVLRKGRHADRTLFLCWPPYHTPMAYVALRRYAGSTLAYIGEDDGCTGDERFRKLLDTEWHEVHRVRIPQWDGLHDTLTIWKRK